MRKTLIPGAALALLLTNAACDPATLGITAASVVLDAVVNGGETVASQAPNIMEALGGLDDQVSESCLAKIDQLEGNQNTEPKDVEISTRAGESGTSVEEVEVAEVEQSLPAESDVPQLRDAETSATLSSETKKVCRLQPVCLPGNSFPIEMMMCSEEVVVAGADGQTVDPNIDTTPRESTWAWSGEEEGETPTP